MAEPGLNADLTLVLQAAAAGDSEAGERLLPLIYDELHKLARARMRNLSPDNTLQPTALVHEAYLKLVGSGDPGWSGRHHFFGAAAQAMRNILVDQARRKAAVKHGGDRKRVGVQGSDGTPLFETPREDLLSLDEALQRLEKQDPRKAEIVMLRYFAGLSEEETAAVLSVSTRTVEREWRYIKAWLRQQLDPATRMRSGDG